MSAQFDAADIYGKTLIAKKDVSLYRLPLDSAKPVYTVKAGQSVGVVYSHVEPKPGRSNMYWMFKDEKERPYYAKHEKGLYSVSAIKSQGVKTTEDKIKEEARANETTKDWIERNLKNIALIIGGAVVVGSIVKSKKQ